MFFFSQPRLLHFPKNDTTIIWTDVYLVYCVCCILVQITAACNRPRRLVPSVARFIGGGGDSGVYSDGQGFPFWLEGLSLHSSGEACRASGRAGRQVGRREGRRGIGVARGEEAVSSLAVTTGATARFYHTSSKVGLVRVMYEGVVLSGGECCVWDR